MVLTVINDCSEINDFACSCDENFFPILHLGKIQWANASVGVGVGIPVGR
jgi:hypothetical protein